MATKSDRLELSTVDALAQLSFHVQGLLEARASVHGLSLIQTRLLGILRDRKPTMNELAALLNLDKSSVTGLVGRAEKRGLVQRRASTQDRRVVLVGLTSEGARLVSAVAAQFAADVDLLVHPLAATERARLTASVTRILSAVAADRGLDLRTSTR